MKKRLIISLVCVVSALISCQKSDTESSIAGEWYHSVDVERGGLCYGFDSYHYTLNRNSSFEYHTDFTDLSALLGPRDVQFGGGPLAIVTNETYIGTYEFKDGILTLCCDYHIDDDSGKMDISAKTFTYKILTSPVTRTTTTIEVYNNQTQEKEVWERN